MQVDASDWVGVAGLVVTTAGFAITIWQLARTARASEATRRAVERTEQRVAVNHVLVLLPQFRIIEHDLDSAAFDNDRRLALRALVSYSHMASEVSTLLATQEGIDPQLITLLKSTARNASVTKGRLINESSRHAKIVTKEFREELAEVSGYVGGLVSTLTVRTTSD